ncbi:MAG: DUF4238 domain-containing protein [Marinobacter psychrophilus]|nr:DUF4238 domain-containing protein [Marinobacter psychrophilus]
MTARHHHYLSQCYLKEFTKGRGKKSKLAVIDFREKKTFETIPRNVGGIRDFNRIDVEGVDPNLLESQISEFESEAARALKKLNETRDISGDVKEIILSLIALIAIRSPERREHMRSFHADIAERITSLSLENKERWESQVKRIKEENPEFNDSISYEEVKEFFESKNYSIEVAREYHIHMEMVQIETILPLLFGRSWVLLTTDAADSPFITSDNPVCLNWKEPEKIPPFYRNSPGFGLKGTQVYFPVSKDLALIGDFEGQSRTAEADEYFVAGLNTIVMNNLYKQLYAPKLGFKFHGPKGVLLNGNRVLSMFNA